MEGRSLLIKIGMVLLSLALCLGLTGLGGAQEKYPTRAITFITGLQAGDSTDMVWRHLISAASKILGQPIIVMNKPGGAHAIALVAIKNAKPDGYTIGGVPSGPASGQLMNKVPYDVLKDFTFIMQPHGYRHGVLVQAGAPWKTIQELTAYAKDNPGKVRMGVLNVGAGQHIAMERLSAKLGIKFNIIPFASATVAVTNLLGGHVEAICSASTWVPNVEAGQFRLLAVAGAEGTRMTEYPNVPSLMELYGFDLFGFGCLAGPKGLPPHVVDTIHKAFKKAMEDPDFIKTAEKFAVPIVYRGPEDITKFIHEYFDIMGDVLKKLGLLYKG